MKKNVDTHYNNIYRRRGKRAKNAGSAQKGRIGGGLRKDAKKAVLPRGVEPRRTNSLTRKKVFPREEKKMPLALATTKE